MSISSLHVSGSNWLLMMMMMMMNVLLPASVRRTNSIIGRSCVSPPQMHVTGLMMMMMMH